MGRCNTQLEPARHWKQNPKSLARVRPGRTLLWLGFDRVHANRWARRASTSESMHWMVLQRPVELAHDSRRRDWRVVKEALLTILFLWRVPLQPTATTSRSPPGCISFWAHLFLPSLNSLSLRLIRKYLSGQFTGRDPQSSVRFCQSCVEVVSLEVISYLKLSGSRLSSRPSEVSACGYIRKPTGGPLDPGRATSCAKLYAIQFISQEPNRRFRAIFTMSSSRGRFPGGSSSTTLRTSAGSTGTQPKSLR